MATPIVSIGLPVYNGQDFVADAIESILYQSYSDIELIICDNFSKDETYNICETYARKDKRIRLYRNSTNLGAIPNYNRVFKLSKGKYFKWAAHDDLIDRNFISYSVKLMDSIPQSSLCFSGIKYIDENNDLLFKSSYNLTIDNDQVDLRLKKFFKLQKENNDIFWSIFGLMRSEILRKTNLLQSFVASDQALLITLLVRGKFIASSEYLFSRRIHKGASTVSLPQNKTLNERARWYNFSNPSSLVLPNWQLIFYLFPFLWQANIPFPTNFRSIFWIFILFLFRSKRLIREIFTIPKQIF